MSGPASDDWGPFIDAVAQYQRQSERDRVFLRDRAEIEQRLTDLDAFHRALTAPDVTADELAASASALSTGSVGGTTAPEMEQLRHDLARHPIRFTAVEPPSCAVHLARSFARVSRLMGLDAQHEFLFATDDRYRPHASVQQWSDRRYLVLMGRYVVEDFWALSLILAQLVALAGAAFPDLDEPWRHPDFPQALLDAAEQNPYLHQQIAYGMCAAVEGERYRIGFSAADLAPEQSGRLVPAMYEIAHGAMDFLVGHELAHVYCGHVQAPGRAVHDSPWFAEEAFERVRASANGAATVETYLREYWPAHSQELEADLFAMMSAADIGAAFAQDLRLVGIQFAVGLLSFLDRADYLTEFGYDPAEAVGLDGYNRVPGLVDVMLPRTTHPWGKTRATAVPSEVRLVYQRLVEPAELERKARLMQAVGTLLASASGPALNAIRWIEDRPGESLALVLPDDRLVTRYWPPDATIEDDKVRQFESVASRFYTDLADPASAPTVLPLRHAVEMIRRVAGPGLLDGAEPLCRALGCLVPAIEQAAAYMKQHQLSAADYLDLLPAPGDDDPAKVVAATSRISLDQIMDQYGPLPEGLLRTLSWYAPDDIPTELLFSGQGELEALMHASLAGLETYALLVRSGDAVAIRPLVQAVMRAEGPTEGGQPVFPLDSTRELAIELLDSSLPPWSAPRGWPVWRRFLPHIDALADHLAAQPADQPPVALWSATANYLMDQGRTSRALAYHRRAWSEQQDRTGPHHPDTLALLHNLGQAHIAADDPSEAIRILDGVLTEQEKVIGARHPDALTTRNSLASAYLAAGEPARAIPLFVRTVADRRRVLGRRHPETLGSQNDLATAYLADGDPSRAIPLLRKVAARSRRVNGRDHPDVVIARGNLARAYYLTGRHAKAVPLLERSVADHERVFGPDHPSTQDARAALASARTPPTGPEPGADPAAPSL
ncbi:tetratricopeptide repeat protein [Actinomadura rupiterrae]|uniref:tetratricopeptide repeat protein n=1 Tax=Actinomadura rupiterrae TaxID=559627 RepID=UPI0020A350AD|nr:tetratricopeptide repeat protein [Actinomadura rupiterrae]MCP2341519.1 tetratricopeptide (TPR) repeat protein [Actinomadura rupiterrae]